MNKSTGSSGPLSKLVEKLRTDRKLELFVYGAIICTALIIFALSGGISCGWMGGSSGGERDNSSYARTEDEIERKLAEMLSGIRGAGRVKVMVIRGCGANAEADDTLIGGLWEKGSGGASSGERAVSIEGVIVTAEGADDIRVRTDIQSAVRTLLGIGSDRIGVYSMQKDYSEHQQNGGN